MPAPRKKQARRGYKQARANVDAAVDDMSERGGAMMDAAQDAAYSIEETLEDVIVQRPLATVGLALGLGFLIGATWRVAWRWSALRCALARPTIWIGTAAQDAPPRVLTTSFLERGLSMFQRMIDDFKQSTGSALQLTSLAAAMAFALFVTFAFLCAAAFVYVLQNYGLIEACLAGAGVFLVAAMIAGICYSVRRNQIRTAQRGRQRARNRPCMPRSPIRCWSPPASSWCAPSASSG